jgi:hypothetical protein
MVNQEMQMASMRAKCGLSTGLSSRSYRDDKGCAVRASDISKKSDIVADLKQQHREIIIYTEENPGTNFTILLKGAQL